MWTFEILLIFHVSLLLAQELGGYAEDTMTTQVSKDIVPILPAPLSVLSVARTSSKLIPPATTSSSDLDGNAEFYVIGGRTVAGRIYPWIVSIRGRNNDHMCAGSLISTRSVLTTASCARVFSPDIKDVTVVLGSNFLNGRGVGVVLSHLAEIKLHKNFSVSDTSYNDLAILTLKSPVTVSNSIQPVSLGTSRTMAGTKVKVAGWGSTTAPSTSLSDSLQHLELDVIANSDCSARYGQYSSMTIKSEQLCAGIPGKNTCVGDNGDPLMQNGVLVGVFSLGIDCNKYPGIYTRVASYLPWINKYKS